MYLAAEYKDVAFGKQYSSPGKTTDRMGREASHIAINEQGPGSLQ